jgi:tetratricopeptide (TPR) repeat protein
MTTLPQDFCPYKGLQPYTENDRAFFFGRERDQEIIISNLYASQLTALYGASGVGKSSVLLAGVVPQLRTEARLAVVVFRNWQDAGFVNELKEAALRAVRESVGKVKGGGREVNVDASLPLDEFLAQAARALRGPVFFIFDQFEEYFLYHPQSDQAEGFEAEFARAVNRRDVDVNFLLSLREDGLSKLDRFQGRIPTLLNNMLRLEHLDRNAARDAVTKPLDVYNRETQNGQPPMTIEPPLIEMLLNDLSAVKVGADHTGHSEVNSNGDAGTAHTANIETPFLQMVLTRLWDEEKSSGSRVMRLETFEKLGRAEQIARTHLDTLMSKLTDDERNTAARVLRYLVTPSGTKIAQEPAALASWSELREEEVDAILNRLSAPDMRILRTVSMPNQAARFEIFHDVLAAAVLDWRRRISEQQRLEEVKREEQELRAKEQAEAARQQELDKARRTRRAFSVMSVLLLVMCGLAAFAFWEMHEATRANRAAKIAQDSLEEERQAEIKEQKAALEQQIRNAQIANEHLRQGQVFVQSKKYVEGIEEFYEALNADPKNSNAYQMKGYALYKMGKYLSAIESFQEAIQLAPDNQMAHYNLALAYWADQEPEKAIAEVRKVLALDPKSRNLFINDSNFKPFTQSPEYKALIYPPGEDN